MSPEVLEKVIHAGIAKLPVRARQYLEETHFSPAVWAQLGASVASNPNGEERRRGRNVVGGSYEWPGAFEAMANWNEQTQQSYQRMGSILLAEGKVATIVMAGGMATRMAGVVKALMPLDHNINFLDARLSVEQERLRLTQQANRNAPFPLWLMTSLATHDALDEFVKTSNRQETIRLFCQDVGIRFTQDGQVWRDAAEAVGICAAGHGCLIDAVRRSGLLSDFISSGGQYVFIVNIDNIAATLDPSIIGWLASQPNAPGLVEVCDRLPTDRGGVVLRNKDTGFDEIVEEFRLPDGFKGSDASIFNTNTFLVRADVLLSAPVVPTWLEVEKKVNDVPVVQFERLIQELTASVNMLYLRVPREGLGTRFLPLKDKADLETRKNEIAALLNR